MENDTVIQFQNNQSIELLDPVNKWRKRREASNERNQKGLTAYVWKKRNKNSMTHKYG